MVAARQNVVIEQGVTVDIQLHWTGVKAPPIEASWSGMLQIRAHPGDTDPPLLELSTDNGRLVIDAQRKEMDIHLEAADTVDLAFVSGVYDLVVWDPAAAPIEAYRVLEGTAWLAPVVTRP